MPSVSAGTSGVPPGIILRPQYLLILIYINDMPSTVSSTTGLFADHANIYRLKRNIDN